MKTLGTSSAAEPVVMLGIALMIGRAGLFYSHATNGVDCAVVLVVEAMIRIYRGHRIAFIVSNIAFGARNETIIASVRAEEVGIVLEVSTCRCVGDLDLHPAYHIFCVTGTSTEALPVAIKPV